MSFFPGCPVPAVPSWLFNPVCPRGLYSGLKTIFVPPPSENIFPDLVTCHFSTPIVGFFKPQFFPICIISPFYFPFSNFLSLSSSFFYTFPSFFLPLFIFFPLFLFPFSYFPPKLICWYFHPPGGYLPIHRPQVCPVLAVLSCQSPPGFSSLAVLPWRFCPGCSVLGVVVLSNIFCRNSHIAKNVIAHRRWN